MENSLWGIRKVGSQASKFVWPSYGWKVVAAVPHFMCRSLGGIELQGHPSNFIFSTHGGDVDHEYVLLLNVYVDDSTLSGDRCCHESFWGALSSKVTLGPFQEIDKEGFLILGRRHFIERSPSTSKSHSTCVRMWIRL